MKRRDFLKSATLAGAGLLIGCYSRNRFDIIIRNGQVFDGLGHPARRLDLGLRGNQIVALADLSQALADLTIDASGLVVAPGFIDCHSHTDIELLVNPRAESKIHQGITTEISGNCGDSPFPLNENDFREYQRRIREQYGIEVGWRDARAFFRAIQRARPAFNYASFTGHGALRAMVVGKNDVPPASVQIRQMQQILAETLEMGSLGLSTGLEYAPGSYAKTDELIALCQTVARYNGVYATHMRNEDDRVEEAVAEALQICRAASVSLEISHLKACNQSNWYKEPRLLDMLTKAAESGLPVQADRYPYNAWSTGLTAFLPLWARQGEREEVLARLKDRTLEAEIRQYIEARGQRIGGWDKVVISDCFTAKNSHYEGQSIAQACRQSGQSPFTFIRDLLLVEENRVGVIGFAMSEENLKQTLAHPLVTIGSDGSAVAPYGKLSEGKPHPRHYGTFPRVLGKYCREEQIFDLATAIHKMTAQPAQKLGLKQRGCLEVGYYADVVIFNPQTIIDRATFADPHQYPAGIEYVFVNGQLVIEHGQHTGRCPGEILRSQRS